MLLVGLGIGYGCILLGIFLGLTLSRLIYLSEYLPGKIAFSSAFAIIFFAASMTYLHRGNNTKARIEISGNTIKQFDETGYEILSDDLNQIAIVYESLKYSPNRRNATEYYHVLFTSGNLLTFNEFLENDFTLKKKLKTRTQREFHRIDWAGYEVMKIESKESRAAKAKRIPKVLEKEFWDPGQSEY